MNYVWKHAALVAALIVSPLMTSAAVAAPPPWIVGDWTLYNGQSPEKLTIISQGAAGVCRQIVGEFAGIAPVHGFYCPDTGRIQLVHQNVETNQAVRVFTGNLTDYNGVGPMRMAGTYTIVNVAFGPFSEQGFAATK